MLNLQQAARLRKGAGEKLPVVFRVLEENGVHIRRGQLTLIASASGVGKSVLSLAYAVQSRAPTLYLSMDTPARTMTVRAAQMVTSYPGDRVEDLLEDDEFSEAVFADLRHISFSFRSGIDFVELTKIVAAYAERYGEYPALIVVDNLRNLAFGDDEGAEMRRLMNDLHQLSRMTGSAVVVLHHVTGHYDDGLTPVPQSGIEQKLSKMPDLILTVTRDVYGTELYVAPVKVRSGKADPSGRTRYTITALMDSMQLSG